MTTIAKIAIAVGVILLGWWAYRSFVPSDSEKVAVAEEQARVAAESARRDSARVKALETELAAARTESQRVDTVVRTILRNRPPVRPVTPTGPALDSLGTDSLKALLTVSVAYGDTVTKENLLLRATLDTALRAFHRFEVVVDTMMAAQARQIVAQRQQITAMQVIIDVRECRVLGLLKCPSRKLVALGAAGLTYIAVRAVKR